MSPRRAVPQKPQGGTPSWLVVAGVAIVAVIAVIIGADFVTKIQPPPAGPSVSGVTASGRTRGDANAPVNFVEYSDFQ